MKSIVSFTALAVLAWSTASSPARAQMVSTEERFQDLFVTAGYGTAFGAAFGAALLSFQAQPSQNLRFVAIGASVGFIGGSLIGSYVIFTPVFSETQNGPKAESLWAQKSQKPQLSGLQAEWTVLRF
jgi:hypothetical protein